MSEKREELVFDGINETIVIGAAIADDEKRQALVRTIAADEMLVPENATMWRALRALVDRKLSYDPEVFRRLVRDEQPDFDEDVLLRVEQSAETPANLEWHIETLRWDACRVRVLRGPLPELLRDLKDPKASPELVAGSARAVLRSVEGGHGRKYIRRPEELNRTYRAEIAARRAAGNFFASGYTAMDTKLVEGTMPGKVAVLVGLSGSGKSTFACDFVLNLAKAGRRVLMCAWEMGSESTLDVMVSNMARIDLSRLVQGQIDDDEAARVEKVTAWITSKIKFMENAFYDQKLRGAKGQRDNNKCLDLLEGYIAEAGCDVVVMDLWERCLADLSYDGVTQALYRQQQMAAEYRFYCVIVHQLRLKDVEKRIDKRPTREGIKGTGAYVEVADQIYGVHRDAQFKAVPDDSLEVICMKQRKGIANWAIRFDWSGAMSRISNGVEVAYDPGLESSAQFGDMGDVSDIKTGSGSRRKS